MGSMTLEDFRDELKFDLKNRNDPGFSNARLNRWIDWSYIHVCHPTVFRHPEMETLFTYTLATGTNSLSMTSATVGFVPTHIRSVLWSESNPVTTPTTVKAKIYPRNIHVYDKRIVTSGRPSQYSTEGTNLLLHQVPTSVENGQFVTARFYQEPTALASDTTTTVIPRFWDEVISLGAKWRAEMRLGYREMAELTKQDYAALINEIAPRTELEAADTGWEVELNRTAVGI